VRLADYKVRILDPDQATDATTRVFLEAACDEERWSTVGCSQKISSTPVARHFWTPSSCSWREKEERSLTQNEEVVA